MVKKCLSVFMHILFLNNLSAHRPAPVPWPNIPRASFRGCWRGLRTPRRLQNYIFRTTPKAENGQSTVKCRDYFIFQAPKCTRATFSRSLAPDPMHRASLQTRYSWWGWGLLSRSLRRPRSQPFGPATSAFRPRFTQPHLA